MLEHGQRAEEGCAGVQEIGTSMIGASKEFGYINAK
jgi:hypothetical protein